VHTLAWRPRLPAGRRGIGLAGLTMLAGTGDVAAGAGLAVF
jgi:hypothetical protein